MRRIANTRIAALVAALVAGALAAYALRSSPTAGTSAGHVQQQAVEVRTQVIRRTVHIVRHERPHHPPSRRSATGAGASAGIVVAGARAVRSASSGAHGATSGGVAQTVAPRTRTSGAPAAGTPSVGSAGGGRVRTRTSGGGEHGDGGDGGGHDD